MSHNAKFYESSTETKNFNITFENRSKVSSGDETRPGMPCQPGSLKTASTLGENFGLKFFDSQILLGERSGTFRDSAGSRGGIWAV